MSGGGGYGDPSERSRRGILDDVEDGLTTVDHARRTYDVDPSETEP
jgi:N-methylhydantoinase B/oxoprolinase/acetone carboxylase alpha subunit